MNVSEWRCYVCKYDTFGPTQRCDRCGATVNEPRHPVARAFSEPILLQRPAIERVTGLVTVTFVAVLFVVLLGLVIILAIYGMWRN